MTPAGGATVAVLVVEVKAEGDTFATRRYVALPPESRDTADEMLPAPPADAQLDPAEAEQVHVADAIAGAACPTPAPA